MEFQLTENNNNIITCGEEATIETPILEKTSVNSSFPDSSLDSLSFSPQGYKIPRQIKMPNKRTRGNNKGITISSDERARKMAQFAALGLRPKQIRKELGLCKTNHDSLKRLRKIAYEEGYTQRLQESQDKEVINIREEMKRIAGIAVENLMATQQMILANTMDDYKLALEKKKIDPNYRFSPDLKGANFSLDFINSTEFSGKKLDPPQVQVNILDQSQTKIEDAGAKIDAILAKYVPKKEQKVLDMELNKE